MIHLAYFKDRFALSEAISLLIRSEKDFKLKFESTRINEISYLLGKNKIDLLIVSATAASTQLFEAIRKEFPHLRIIILGSGKDHDYGEYGNYNIGSVLHLNVIPATGVFNSIRNALKNSAPEVNVTRTKQELRKNNISGAELPFDPRKLFTRREREVIELLRDGHLRKRVADKLHVDLVTIHKHVNNCLHKSGYHKLEQLFDNMDLLENQVSNMSP